VSIENNIFIDSLIKWNSTRNGFFAEIALLSWIPRNLGHQKDRQARAGDTVLVQSREMTIRTQILPVAGVKKAVELLDVPSRNTSLMLKKYNGNVEFFCLSTYVLFFPLCHRMKKFDKNQCPHKNNESCINVEQIQY
jgi:hypothetical protein